MSASQQPQPQPTAQPGIEPVGSLPPLQQPPALLAAAPVAAQHRSWDNASATSMRLQNDTQRLVRVLWLDFQGREELYSLLPPGSFMFYHTWSTHPWVCRDVQDPTVPLVVNDEPVFYVPCPPPGAPSTAYYHLTIREAQRLPWSPSLHHLAPPAFRAQACALLCCWQRLSAAPAVGAKAGQGAWRGRLRSSRRLVAGNLGDLPQDLLLAVVQAAAPTVPLLLKPAQPDGLQPERLPAGTLAQLFAGEEEGRLRRGAVEQLFHEAEGMAGWGWENEGAADGGEEAAGWGWAGLEEEEEEEEAGLIVEGEEQAEEEGGDEDEGADSEQEEEAK